MHSKQSISLLAMVLLSHCGCQNVPNKRSDEVRAYPEVPPIAVDVNWSSEHKPSAHLIQYVLWINGAGQTNAPFQKWLAQKIVNPTTRTSLVQEYLEWMDGPGATNKLFQEWLDQRNR